MELYTPKKLRASWHFDNKKYSGAISNYPEIKSDLKHLLAVLIETKMLLPKLLEGKSKSLKYNNVDDLIDLIEEDNYLQNCLEFGIKGDTIIYTENGEEIYSDIFCLEGFRTFDQSFVLSTKSDIWLPMSFDEDNYLFVWNLERYNLNNHRISDVLKKINKNLNWDNQNLLVKEFHERGSLQIDYDIYLSKEVITREYNENPNSDFNINEYATKVES